MIATKNIGEELKEIASKVNYTLKIEAVNEFGVHYNTVARYLKGEVPDCKERFATKLLDFFKSKIPV